MTRILAEGIEFRPFSPAHADAISALVQQVFNEHVAPGFGPEGVAEMHAYVAPEAIADRARSHTTIVAWQGTEPVGVLEVRDMSHISMLFVRTSHMGAGIGSVLMARAESACRAAARSKLTVNSSLGAQGFYRRLGFAVTTRPQYVRGFAFVPMEKQLLMTVSD